jgi:two-component system, OmpR family, phosphate regulon response regulator PhoB
MPVHILVVDPDPHARQLIEQNLHRAGHQTSCAADAESALLAIGDSLPDLLLLEWDLPGQCGISLVRRLRAQPRTRALPVIMLSARAGEHDTVLALESGADDYIVKPFSPRATLARIHALLRRLPGATANTLQMAGLHLDPGTHRVSAGTHALSLGRIEFQLLNYLMHHPERVHTRAQLLDQVWGSQAVLHERTVDAHVGRLRSALAPSGHQRHIETVRGSGYRFIVREDRLPYRARAAARHPQ